MKFEQGRPKYRRKFGQNFLVNRGIIEDILVAFCPKPTDHLIEIGAGLGALTHDLIQAGCLVEAIEIDRDLANRLKIDFSHTSNFKLHITDALSFDYQSNDRNEKKIRVIGNLPYNISTPLLFKLFEAIDSIEDMHFMVQLEVAKRLLSSPGEKTWGRLSILTQYHCHVIHLFNVAPHAFRPKPKVQSAFVRLIPVKKNINEKVDPIALSNTARLAFSKRRKTLRNNLKDLMDIRKLENIGIDLDDRAEALDLKQFVKLTKIIYGN